MNAQLREAVPHCPLCGPGYEIQYLIERDGLHCRNCKHDWQMWGRWVYPEHWERGQLLNVRRFTDQSFVVTRIDEDFDSKRPERALHFRDGETAQAFVSWWYAPTAAREAERESETLQAPASVRETTDDRGAADDVPHKARRKGRPVKPGHR